MRLVYVSTTPLDLIVLLAGRACGILYAKQHLTLTEGKLDRERCWISAYSILSSLSNEMEIYKKLSERKAR